MNIVDALKKLQEINHSIGNQDNAMKLSTLDDGIANNIISCLTEMNTSMPEVVTQNMFNYIIYARNNLWPKIMNIALLHRINPVLVTQNNFQSFIDSGVDIAYVTDVLMKLNKKNPALATLENMERLVDIINRANDASSIAPILDILYRANPALITLDNIEITSVHTNEQTSNWLKSGLERLKEERLLNQANFQSFMFNAQVSGWLAGIFTKLQAEKMLTQENFQILVDNPWAARSIFNIFKLFPYNNGDVFLKIISNIRYIKYIEVALGYINQNITEEFNKKNLCISAVLSFDPTNPTDIINKAIAEIDKYKFVHNYYTYVEKTPEQQEDIARALLATLRERERGDAQSTHFASIHKSASESAKRLMMRYGELIDSAEKLGRILAEVKEWAQSLPSPTDGGDPNNVFIRDCVARITAPTYNHIDKESNISVKQLLALSWLAIHDSSSGKRQGNENDALRQFAQGLIEMQNGDGFGNPICASGAFNKFIEKLTGVHNDVELIVITPAAFSAKLHFVIQQHMKLCLTALARTDSAKDYEIFMQLIENVRNNGAAAVWHIIQDNVTNILFGEFGSLFKDKDDKIFTDALIVGKDSVMLDEDFIITHIEQLALNSTGGCQYARQQQLRLLTRSALVTHGTTDEDTSPSVGGGGGAGQFLSFVSKPSRP